VLFENDEAAEYPYDFKKILIGAPKTVPDKYFDLL
jgi:hypothetical protein